MNGVASQPAGAPTHYPSHAPPTANGYGSPQATAAAALSQQPGDAPAPANGRKRKASGVPGSRGVANLTPDQLAKKRANDREAQRAIRERTRNTIDSLERRIRELESQQPFQELQRAIAERDSALRECDDLRRKLATVAQVVGGAQSQALQAGGAAAAQAAAAAPGASLNGTLSPSLLVGSDEYPDPSSWLNEEPETELAALTAQQSPLPPLQHHQQQQHNPFPSHSGAGYEPQHVHPDLRSPTYSSSTSQVSHVGKWSPAFHPQSNGVQYEQQQPPAPQMQQHNNGERAAHMGVNFLLDSKGSPQQPAAPAPAPEIPVWERLPNISPPTCPLDSLLNDFIAARKQMLKDGAPMHEVLGPEYPSFVALQDPTNHAARQSCHGVSALLIDILSKFPDISALPEKVAVLYVMFLVMRWFICPTEACYNRLPEWIRPVTEQLEHPHATWVDNLPWSVPDSPLLTPPSLTLSQLSSQEDGGFDFDSFFQLPESEGAGEKKPMTADDFTNKFLRPFMRKRLITNGSSNFDEFFVPFTTTLSLNWPYPAEQVLFPSSDADSRCSINPSFETHLRDLSNWSLGSDFQRRFGELVTEEVNIRDKA